MDSNSIFRLKVQYQAVNQETGDVEKTKLEILTQCVNYTDAEAVMNKIAEEYQMNKFEPCVYGIVKAKFSTDSIYGGETFIAEDNGALTLGLIQHSFEEEADGLYAVETIVFGNKENKEKDLKQTFYIPAKDVAHAMKAATEILTFNGHNLADCIIPSAKLDNASYVYLRPTTSERIFNQAIKIFK